MGCRSFLGFLVFGGWWAVSGWWGFRFLVLWLVLLLAAGVAI